MNIEFIAFVVVAIGLWLLYGIVAISMYRESKHQLDLVEKSIRTSDNNKTSDKVRDK